MLCVRSNATLGFLTLRLNSIFSFRFFTPLRFGMHHRQGYLLPVVCFFSFMAHAPALYADPADSVIRYNSQEGNHIDLLPSSPNFPRSDIKFGNWVLGQYSGIGPTDFFLYNSVTHSHPLVISPQNEITINHAYDNVHNWDAYDKLPSPLNVITSYGRKQPSSGTAIGLQNAMDIYNEAVPTHGHNEFSAYYAYVRANNRGVHPPGQHYWVTDFQLQTPYAPQPQKTPELGIVYSGRIMNMSYGVQALSSSHMGAYGQSLVATPMLENELTSSGIPLDARSFPITAMLALAGFSGDRSTYDGTLSSAGPAADYALRIGGGGGSPYIPFNARSNFGIGVGLYDWSKAGLEIDRRLPGATGPGLRNRYATELGGRLPAGAWPYSLILHDEHAQPTRPAQAGLQLGDDSHAWLLGNTSHGDEEGQFSIAYKHPEQPQLTLSRTGIGFMGHPPITPPKIHSKFDLSKKIDPQELAKAYNSIHDALTSLGLAQ